jgi:collagenase-like PrtC family protease
MKYLCMPADFRLETLEAYAKLNERSDRLKIHETYGNLNPSPFQSGRAVGSPRLPKVSEEELREYIRFSKARGISLNYTLNASCSGGREFTSAGLRSLLGTLDRLVELGVECVTLTTPAHIAVARSHFPSLELCTSVICELDSVAAVRAFAELGATRIIVSEDAHRQFDILRSMKRAVSLPLEVLTNSTCLFRCPWKAFHYNLLSHMSSRRQPDIEAYYHWECMAVRTADPSELLKLRWIRPEDLDLYEDATYFKVVGRYFATDSDLPRVAQIYMDRRFDGNLWDLLGNFAPQRRHGIRIDNRALDGFVAWFKASPRHCSEMACATCSHCEEFARRAVDVAALAASRERLDLPNLTERIQRFHQTGRSIQAMSESEIFAAAVGW